MEERFFVSLPLFDPQTGKMASDGRIVTQIQFYGRDFTRCCLLFADGSDKVNLLTPTANLKAHNSDNLNFSWSASPSWLTYRGRPYPAHRIWQGAVVNVTLGICDSWNNLELGTGQKATVTAVIPDAKKYEVQFNEPVWNKTSNGFVWLEERQSFYPFQLSFCNPFETPEQDFYIWLSQVMEACIPSIGGEIEQKITANWLDAESGGLMRRLYALFYRENAASEEAICYINGDTPQDVGKCLWVIENSKSPKEITELINCLGI